MIAYKYKIYPNKIEQQKLNKTLDLCRFTYNKLLEELQKQEKINRGIIQHKIVELKQEFPELQEVYSKTLQYECYRLFSNLRVLSQLKKNGKKVGRLRFKGRDWFKTLNYNQSGYKFVKTDKHYSILKLSNIGEINLRLHREFDGRIKQIAIKKSNNKWYAILLTDGKKDIQKGIGNVGIDLGIINFIADSNNNKIKSPLFLKKDLNKLKVVQQNLFRKKKGSANRRKARLDMSKIHEDIGNKRLDFLHKLSYKYVTSYDTICIEKLNIKEMSQKDKYWNKRNIIDCSWGKFASLLRFKAESAGTKVIDVNPRNTTKTCSCCGTIKDMSISQRTYNCECGNSLDRDINSARNILAQGLGIVETFSSTQQVVGQEESMKQEAIILNTEGVRL